MKSILITGAAGGLGGRLRKLLRPIYPNIRLSDAIEPKALGADETFVRADLTNPAEVEAAVEGMEGIIHLGGRSIEDRWEAILPANIIGTYNLFEAARRHKVRRVVFASSFHVIGFYRRDRRFGTDVPPHPDSRYGVSKVFGEALGALYADKFGLRVLCIRIGNVDDTPVDARRLSGWLSPDDFVQLLRIGLEHPDLHYEIVYGISGNARAWWDNAAAFRLGYRPTGDAEVFRDIALAAESRRPDDPIARLFQGGPFTSLEFDGDLDRIR